MGVFRQTKTPGDEPGVLLLKCWIPAFAGMTGEGGMTAEGAGMTARFARVT